MPAKPPQNQYSLVRLRDLHLRVLAMRLKRRLYRITHKGTKIRILVSTMTARVRTEIEFHKTEEKPGKPDKIYTVLLDFPLDSSNSFSQMVRRTGALVYCSCEDFKFRLAYALKVKNLLIAKRRALGRAFYEYPKITNPQLKVRACKHITMAVEALRGKTVTELAEPSAKGIELFLNY
jgi:hypothetical protein